MTRLRDRRSIVSPYVALVAVIAAVLLASCFVLVQNKTFAIGTESTRANLVVHKGPTVLLDDFRRANGTADTRNLFLTQVPDRLTFSNDIKNKICLLSPALCMAVGPLSNVVLSWLKSDVRNRGDFGEAIKQARDNSQCFAWTFIAGGGRNFTRKPTGNSGCRS